MNKVLGGFSSSQSAGDVSAKNRRSGQSRHSATSMLTDSVGRLTRVLDRRATLKRLHEKLHSYPLVDGMDDSRV